jgi:hypothetical protein
MTGLFLTMWLACSGGAGAPSTEPEAIAALATQIADAPGEADSLLEAAGHTRGSFDDALYDIAMDPEKTKRYLDAR